MAARTQFYLDPQNGKLKGVCAGVADYTGFDVTLVRLAVVVMTLFTGVFVVAYLAAMLIAPAKPTGLYDTPDDARFWQGVRTNTKRSTAEVRSKLRDVDRRLADMETFYTSRDTQLADQIDALR